MFWISSCWKFTQLKLCYCRRTKKSLCILITLFLAAVQLIFSFVWLDTRNVVPKSEHKRNTRQLRESIAAVFNAPPVIDSSGEYRILKWIVKPRLKRQFKSLNISAGETTLVTQCSPDHFHLLLELRQVWEGPISLSVFAISTAELIEFVKVIFKIQQCRPSVFSSVSVHLVTPVSVRLLETPLLERVTSCSGLQRLILFRRNAKNYDYMIPYPNNLLRNVALDSAISDFTLVIDIDMLPSTNLFGQFMDLIRRTTTSFNTAYVVPVFEIRSNESIPKDRAELLRLWDLGAVQPFYHDVCWKCQRHTDYDAWRNLSSSSSQLGIGYIATWHDPWEPFYIVPHFTARYDERFKQYGFNRISQSCELYVAGYQFAVLDNAFLVHRGFKNSRNFHAQKNSEATNNRMLFRQFKSELKERYPYSSRRC